MPITTGYCVGPPFPATSPEVPQSSAIPIFTPETPFDQITSAVVEVFPGRALLFDVYNMPADREIFTLRVVLGCYEPTTVVGGKCPPCKSLVPLGRDAVIIATKKMDIGSASAWIFTPEKTQMLIALPGTYQFELSDSDMLGGDLLMEYREWSLVKTPGLPVLYQGGI